MNLDADELGRIAYVAGGGTQTGWALQSPEIREKAGAAALAVARHALSMSPLPEDVERDVRLVTETIGFANVPEEKTEAARAIVSRLATAAARVPGLEQAVREERADAKANADGLKKQFWQAEQAARTAESERDTAQQEAADLRVKLSAAEAEVQSLSEMMGNVRCMRQECVREREARTAGDARVKELTARVAELEAEKAALLNMEPVRVAREAESSATAAEKRIRDAADRLTSILKSPDRKDPLELETCVDEVAVLHARATAAEKRAAELDFKVQHMSLTTKEAQDVAKHASAVTRLVFAKRADVWFWQGDGSDHPESMVNDLPVVMAASTLRTILAEKPAPTPAPGLREAVSFLPQLRRVADPKREPRVVVIDQPRAAELLRVLDATPPVVPGPAVSCTCAGEGTCAWRDSKVASVPVADLAAVVEEVANHDDGQTLGHDDEDVAYRQGQQWAAREVLRRATGGEVPEVLPKARVVEVLAHLQACVGSSIPEYDRGYRVALEAVRSMLGLKLPTGPGGGERYTDPDLGAVMAMTDAEVDAALTAAGVDVRAFEERTRAHVAKVRASLPPESPYVKANPSNAPEQPDVSPLAGKDVPTGTLVSVSPSFVKVVQRSEPDVIVPRSGGFHVCPDVAARAMKRAATIVHGPQPEPAAPDVEWEGDGVRVLSDGTCDVLLWGEWKPSHDKARNALARALAEAKRENRTLALASEARARKAAEDVRERAAKVASDEATRIGDESVDGNAVEWVAHAIRALPLEDK